MSSLTPPPPPADSSSPEVRRNRKLGWIVIGVALIVAMLLLSQVICAIAVGVAITAGISLGKKTPTFLRFRSPASASRALVIAVVVALVSGAMANVAFPREPEIAAAPADEAPVVPPPHEAEDDTVPATDEVTDTAPTTPTPTPTPTPTVAPEEAEAGTALAALAALDVKGRAPKTGYDRDRFGQRWKDVDRNGCGTRDDILARDLADVIKDGRCTVTSGILDDPFTGQVIPFLRGQDTSADVQIDHVVALSDAWQKGAQQLTAHQREVFANDPLNLLAVDGSANAQKSDGDAATWLPKNKAFRCAYVARQVSVKSAYALWVTQAEYDAIVRVLSECPDEPLLESELAADAMAMEEEPEPAPTKEPEPQPKEPEMVFYANCSEAKAAGAAPVHRGDPGYASHLDRDGDGVGCES